MSLEDAIKRNRERNLKIKKSELSTVNDAKSKGFKYSGANASKVKALENSISKKETKKDYLKRHHNDLMKYETN